ncbi:MAG: D-alanyl-D-alanine carboxypeptidase family protein [Ruminococcus sp.]|nr:D-alanyl-D-alanine carboxypeptidase family protein [Ruminococcus sp.]
MKRRHFDWGRLAVALALLILIIFGVDYLRRCIVGLFVGQPDLNITNDPASSVSQSDQTDSANTTTDSSVESQPDDPLGYDTEQYVTVSMTAADVGKGELILVDAQHKDTSNAAASLRSFQDLKNDCYRLRNFDLTVREEVITALNAMFADFAAGTGLKNVVIYMTTVNDSASFYSTVLPERTAGYSADFALLGDDGSISTFTGDGNYSWIVNNAANYGFIQRYTTEWESRTGVTAQPWHYRYVGAPHAVLMQQNGFCMEEYIDYLRDFTVDGQHASVSVGSQYYEIYFVPAESGNTAVPVPKDGNYTISGNNVDGFIITMELALT